MFKGIARKILLALTLIIALPMALEAQKSARIRVGARLVSSVVPETESATATQIANIAEFGISEMGIAKQSVATEYGIAQIVTESLVDAADVATDLSPIASEADVDIDETRVHVTVAYTAN